MNVNNPIEPSSIESIMQAPMVSLAVVLAQYVAANDLEGMKAFRKRLVDEMVADAMQYENAERRIRLIKGADWKVNAMLGGKSDAEAIDYISRNFFVGGEYLKPEFE